MSALSTIPPERDPEEEPGEEPGDAAPARPEGEPFAASDWVLRVIVPVLVALLFIGVLVYERGASDVDLRVLAPTEVLTGAPVPLRAFVFEGVGGAANPSLASVPVRASWLPFEAGGATLALDESARIGAEGQLIAASSPGEAVAYFVATREGEEIARVQRRVAITATPQPSPRAARATTSAREFQPGRLELASGAPPGVQLDVRVPAGVCVPEIPCDLLVWVGGDTPLQVDLRESEGVARVGTPPPPTTGIAQLQVVLRRLEATLTVLATRPAARPSPDAQEQAQEQADPAPPAPAEPPPGGLDQPWVARRALQLPVAPGALSASVDRYLLPAGSAPELRVRSISGTAAAAVNVFRGGHWVVATSVPESEAAEAGVALPPLQPGVHHIQVQASPWDPQGSAVVVVCAYPEGDSEDACLAALTGDARVRARNDAFAASLRDVHSESPPPEAEHAPAWLAFRFLAFEHANDLHAMPPPSSGVEQAAFGVDARVSTSRVVVALMMILMGLVAASIVLKRAREGANLAESVLRAAGATDEEQEAERGQLSLTTWLSALAVLGAFIVVAIMVLSRGM